MSQQTDRESDLGVAAWKLCEPQSLAAPYSVNWVVCPKSHWARTPGFKTEMDPNLQELVGRGARSRQESVFNTVPEALRQAGLGAL